MLVMSTVNVMSTTAAHVVAVVARASSGGAQEKVNDL